MFCVECSVTSVLSSVGSAHILFVHTLLFDRVECATGNKAHSVCALHPLCKSSKFVGYRVLSAFAKFWVMKELLVFKWGPSIRIKDGVCKIETKVLEGKVWFKEDIMLQFDCCQVVGFQVIDVFNEGWLFGLGIVWRW